MRWEAAQVDRPAWRPCHQPTRLDLDASDPNIGEGMARSTHGDLAALAGEERIRTDDQGAGALLEQRCKSVVEIAFVPGSHNHDLKPKATCCLLNIFRLVLSVGIGRVDEDRNRRGRGCHLMQEREPFGPKPGREHAYASNIPTGPGEAVDEAFIGSSPVVNTIGTVVVAAFAARAEMVPPVAANTLTPRPTSSVINAGN